MMICYGAELMPYFVESLHYEDWFFGCEKSADDTTQRTFSTAKETEETQRALTSANN